jgi:hypothetical protein
MTGKRIAIGNRPVADPGAESWVRQGDGANKVAIASRGDVYSARLTVDVTPELRGRIKVAAFRRGMTVADMLRALLEREFPAEESGV